MTENCHTADVISLSLFAVGIIYSNNIFEILQTVRYKGKD